MRTIHMTSIFVALLIAGTTSAIAQNPPRGQQPPPPAKAGPYKTIPVTPPPSISDPAFEAFRKQMGEAAQHKDRAALAKLVVGKDFFWLRENGDRADKRKSGTDNLAASPEHKGVLCAPADPSFDGNAFNNLMQSTKTDVSEWGYPVAADVEVRATPQANAPVIEKLGLAFIRIVPENGPNAPTFLRVVTPAGKIGFVSVDSVAPIGNDQICYVKDASGWKIGGYIGGGDSP